MLWTEKCVASSFGERMENRRKMCVWSTPSFHFMREENNSSSFTYFCLFVRLFARLMEIDCCCCRRCVCGSVSVLESFTIYQFIICHCIHLDLSPFNTLCPCERAQLLRSLKLQFKETLPFWLYQSWFSRSSSVSLSQISIEFSAKSIFHHIKQSFSGNKWSFLLFAARHRRHLWKKSREWNDKTKLFQKLCIFHSKSQTQILCQTRNHVHLFERHVKAIIAHVFLQHRQKMRDSEKRDRLFSVSCIGLKWFNQPNNQSLARL